MQNNWIKSQFSFKFQKISREKATLSPKFYYWTGKNYICITKMKLETTLLYFVCLLPLIEVRLPNYFGESDFIYNRISVSLPTN